ncbi:MAG TPA: DUF2807 domain-containing protein [Chloroflexi bacterium]|nr:DUF2807 domain-containing protein [Chloroflexota bacterium]
MSDLIKKEYEVEEFHKLAIGGSGKVILNQGAETALSIEAPESVFDELIVKVVEGELRVGMESMSGFRFLFNFGRLFESDRITYYVNVKEIESLKFSGGLRVDASSLSVNDLKVVNSGAVKANYESIQGDGLEMIISGSASVNLGELELNELSVRASGSMKMSVDNGSVVRQGVHISGSADYDAPELTSQEAKFSISGSGKAKVRVESSLDVSISGSGTIHYSGAASVNQRISGSGRVKHVTEEQPVTA